MYTLIHSDKTYRCVVFFLFIYLFFAQLYLAFPFTIDDAYISLQYAKHLSQGIGLVWSPGELPLEGYSNFLTVVITAFFFKLHLPALLSLKLLSIATLALTCLALYQISRFFLPKDLAVLPSVLMLFYRGEILWTVSGLETTVYQCWVVLTVFSLLKGGARGGKRYFIMAGILQALAGLTRPEGPALFLLFGACLCICYQRNATPFNLKKGLLFYVLSFGVLYLPYFAWRVLYFGKLFPNPIYCKAVNTGQLAYTDGVYLYLVLPLSFFMLPALYRMWDRRYYFLLLPSMLYLILLIQADFVVAFFNRLFLPVFVLLLPLLVKGVYVLFQPNAGARMDKTTRTQVLIMTLLIGFCLIHSFSFQAYRGFVAYAAITPELARRQVASWIEKNVRKDERVAMGDCGIVPFLTSRHIIDTYCLNSREMTSGPIQLSYDRYTHWLMNEAKPAYVIIVTMTKDHNRYYQPVDRRLLKHHLFKREYKKINTFNVRSDYFYDIYRKLS